MVQPRFPEYLGNKTYDGRLVWEPTVHKYIRTRPLHRIKQFPELMDTVPHIAIPGLDVGTMECDAIVYLSLRLSVITNDEVHVKGVRE
jgi:hypothetical protein